MKISIVDAVLVGLVAAGAAPFVGLGLILIVDPMSLGTGFLQDNVLSLFAGSVAMLVGIGGLVAKEWIKKLIKDLLG